MSKCQKYRLYKMWVYKMIACFFTVKSFIASEISWEGWVLALGFRGLQAIIG